MAQIPKQYHKYGLSFDCAAHWIHDYCTTPNESDDRYTLYHMLCKQCGKPVVYRYHESGLYSICCRKCGYSAQVKAKNPEEAAEHFAKQFTFVESHGIHLMQMIENPDEVALYYEMTNIIILVRDEEYPFEEKVFPKNLLKWCKDEFADKEYGEEFLYITLGSIARQLRAVGVKGTIMVLYETGLDGTVYRCGNYGNDEWQQVGKLAGWA